MSLAERELTRGARLRINRPEPRVLEVLVLEDRVVPLFFSLLLGIRLRIGDEYAEVQSIGRPSQSRELSFDGRDPHRLASVKRYDINTLLVTLMPIGEESEFRRFG